MKTKNLQELRKKIHGIDSGFNFLDKIALKKLKINYDLDLNDYYQINYLEYLLESYFHNTSWYTKLLNLLCKMFSFDTQVMAKPMLRMILDVFFFIINTNNKNEFKKNIFVSKLADTFNKFSTENIEFNLIIINSLLEVLIEEDFIKLTNYGHNFFLKDREFFLSLRLMPLEFVDLAPRNEYSIKFSTHYLMENLIFVLNFYTHNLNTSVYNTILQIVEFNHLYDLDKMNDFLYDYSILKYKPENFIFDENTKYYEQLVYLLDKVFSDKMIINQYCFNVLAVSFVKNYFFSNLRSKNILFQRLNPIFCLNPAIYDIKI